MPLWVLAGVLVPGCFWVLVGVWGAFGCVRVRAGAFVCVRVRAGVLVRVGVSECVSGECVGGRAVVRV